MPTPCEQAREIKEIREGMTEGRILFNDIKHDMEEMKKDLKAVLAQALKTNGRVTKLESFKSAAQWVLIGALAFALMHSIGLTEFVKEVLK